MAKHYWEGRPEKIIKERYGHYLMTIRYMEDSNNAQVSMEDLNALRLPLIWSLTMNDESANAALNLFKNIGFFDLL
jgi:hypothetical protein